ncbi:MAG: hypothetical protein GF310_04600 [candidate division Zixibacteria bacterium]|nr:hypothetical protein [candidate division Zixibacteria bacterium]
MTYMIVRNRVEDFDRWKAVFDSEAERHRDAGLKLVNLWQTAEDPNNFFFVLEVHDIDKAKYFISAPESAEAGEKAGVLDGEYYFVKSAPGF